MMKLPTQSGGWTWVAPEHVVSVEDIPATPDAISPYEGPLALVATVDGRVATVRYNADVLAQQVSSIKEEYRVKPKPVQIKRGKKR
jgi:hypothetical protein